MKPSQARIPVKLHKNVAIVRTTDPVLAEELLAQVAGAMGRGKAVRHRASRAGR